jgi:ABC-type iron transport system FetAB ATPase subunit
VIDKAQGPRLEVRGWRVGWESGSSIGPLDIDLEAGACVALVGPSGSGKTTLLRSWARLIEPMEGELRLDGALPEHYGWPRFRRALHYLSQRPALGDGTLRDTLERPFTFESSPSDFDLEAALALLEDLGLGGMDLDRRPSTFSEGEQQRVALVRALLLEPLCLLLDEPTSALDEESVSQVEALLAARREGTGMAVIWITHDRQQVARVSSRVLELGVPS